MVSVEFSIDI